MAEFADSDARCAVDYAQHAVGVLFPAGAPASYAVGDHVKFDLSSLSMTDPLDLRDTTVSVKLGSTTLGTFPVTTTLRPPADANSNDEAGTASVDVVIPAGTPAGAADAGRDGCDDGHRHPRAGDVVVRGSTPADPDAGRHDASRDRLPRSSTARPGRSPSR